MFHPARLLVACSAFAALAYSSLIAAHHVPDGLERATTAPAPEAQLESVSGTVRELVIDDRVANMSVRYLFVVAPSGEVVALAGQDVQSLEDGALATATGRRNGNVLFVESVRAAKASPGSARPSPTRRAEGRLALAHADDFLTGKSEYLYEVHADDGTVTALKLGVRPEALQPGMRIAAIGNTVAATDKLDPARIEVLALPDTTPASSDEKAPSVTAKAATTHSVLVILMKFSNTASDPVAVSSVQNVMTGASNSVAKFYQEASYGKHLLNPKITTWLTTTLAAPSSCNYSAIGQAGDAAATAAGYNLSSYEFRVYMFPRVPACGWSGLAYIGSPKKAWINGSGSIVTSVVAHEMGHNFGLLHAASVDCGTRAIGGSCAASEYGDPFNTMGNQRAMHFDAAQKALLGWIPSTAVATHSSGTATYVLSPLETASGSLYAVKIPAAAKRTYWLEYRQPIGFDAFLAGYPNNGAQIRVASPFETLCAGCTSYSDDTELLDMTTGTGTFLDGTLVAGKSYTDPDYGVTVSVLSATPGQLTVQVSGPGSGLAATTTALASSLNPSGLGASVTFTASVSGSAPTGTVLFTDNGAAIAGCSAVALAGTTGTRTASCTTGALTAGSHAILARYGGNAANAASTSATLAQTVNGGATDSNVALASAGATATASSTYAGGSTASRVIDNQRTGAAGDWWTDATRSVWPDWVEIAFNGNRTIDRVVVYSVQDNYTNPTEPADTMTFTRFGLKAFQVQGWNGTSWVTLATVSGNNLVKRAVDVTPYTTSRLRVSVTSAADAYTRITEIEAWGH
ncbi:MAG TPA: Ig-like domain repeat protein [Casimicrobiaceae bacterium]